jgi:heme-degrading monooxygenase HmoA
MAAFHRAPRRRLGAAVIRTVLEMRVREGRTREFEQVWRTAAAVAARYPGAGRQTMLRDPGDPLVYTITADWETREDLSRYQGSRDREELSQVLERLRESASKSLLEVVSHVAPAPAAVPVPGAPSVPAPGTAAGPAPGPAAASVPGPVPVPAPPVSRPAQEGSLRP